MTRVLVRGLNHVETVWPAPIDIASMRTGRDCAITSVASAVIGMLGVGITSTC
jgi:hypothetical protein